MKYLFALGALLLPIAASAQYAWQEEAEAGKLELGKDLHYQVEMQGSFSKGKTPLWLNANKYGLSSLDKNNGYLRGSVIRPLATDSARRWGVGYGVDVAVPVNYTSHVVVQQAFVEARWLHGVLTAGAKQYPMELKTKHSPVVAKHLVSMHDLCHKCDWRCRSIGRFLSSTIGCISRVTSPMV